MDGVGMPEPELKTVNHIATTVGIGKSAWFKDPDGKNARAVPARMVGSIGVAGAILGGHSRTDAGERRALGHG